MISSINKNVRWCLCCSCSNLLISRPVHDLLLSTFSSLRSLHTIPLYPLPFPLSRHVWYLFSFLFFSKINSTVPHFFQAKQNSTAITHFGNTVLVSSGVRFRSCLLSFFTNVNYAVLCSNSHSYSSGNIILTYSSTGDIIFLHFSIISIFMFTVLVFSVCLSAVTAAKLLI